ncbi:HIRAN domain-containing protein [Demequina sp. TTPB684]|uniref:HIRAN domain-containing protein n=1 Tax=unclassified Demequina TaxID=2620311 RepID=UPI001CF566A8|nr:MULTISPECIES: HIRAN domain-containing protein [unclassified Demequina]MCB2412007.1 HIRAN domain-containing protein [Demequina sp. TTPB684]UPU88078.1 HIRAN domain-containing protein [Demequina sp. TMPB413]
MATGLDLRLDEASPGNPCAVLINTADDRKVGYVPDWLCSDVHDLIQAGWPLAVVAERVNLDAPDHVKVLCRIDAVRS